MQCRAWLGNPFLTTRCAVSIKKEKRKQLTIGGARCPMGQVNSEADELSYDIGVCLVFNQLNIVFTSWHDIAKLRVGHLGDMDRHPSHAIAVAKYLRCGTAYKSNTKHNLRRCHKWWCAKSTIGAEVPEVPAWTGRSRVEM